MGTRTRDRLKKVSLYFMGILFVLGILFIIIAYSFNIPQKRIAMLVLSGVVALAVSLTSNAITNILFDS